MACKSIRSFSTCVIALDFYVRVFKPRGAKYVDFPLPIWNHALICPSCEIKYICGLKVKTFMECAFKVSGKYTSWCTFFMFSRT